MIHRHKLLMLQLQTPTGTLNLIADRGIIMGFDIVNQKGIILLGCGKMGSAMLQGWLADGLDKSSVYVLDPYPSDWLKGLGGININSELPANPSVCVIAVKPQMMGAALPKLLPIAKAECVFLSIAAGTSINSFEQVLGSSTKIVRSMPNTPAAIGRGITALIGKCAYNKSRYYTQPNIVRCGW